MLPKIKPPKRLHIRSLQNKKISIGEYSRNQRTNITEPFTLDNQKQIDFVRHLIQKYKKDTDRVILAKIKPRDTLAIQMAIKLKLPIEE